MTVPEPVTPSIMNVALIRFLMGRSLPELYGALSLHCSALRTNLILIKRGEEYVYTNWSHRRGTNGRRYCPSNSNSGLLNDTL